MDTKKIAEDNLIYECIAGSKAYGLDTPKSDTDTRGIFIPPKEMIYSPTMNMEQYCDDTKDRTIFSLFKFANLAVACNPNIIELLYVDQEDIISKHPLMDLLLDNRDIFLSQKARHTFSGYAMSQLKRIKGHNKHLSNPQPKKHPSIVDYLKWITPDGKIANVRTNPQAKKLVSSAVAVKVNKHTYMLYTPLLSLDESTPIKPFILPEDPNNLHHVDTEYAWSTINANRHLFIHIGTAICALDEYKHDVQLWQNYWSWKNNRNEKRSKLENEYGYDTKHGMHLMRLLTMGYEILTEGKVKVDRTNIDRDYLMSIRNGKVSYTELVKNAEEMFSKISECPTDLPHKPDIKMINDIVYQILDEYHTPKPKIGTLAKLYERMKNLKSKLY